MSWAQRYTDIAAREGRGGGGEGEGRGTQQIFIRRSGGPPLNLLYTIVHDFVYLVLTNGTPFTYLA